MNNYARWDRPALKTYAKASLKNFYWKALLVSLVFTLLSGGSILRLERRINVDQLVTQSGNSFSHNALNPFYWSLLLFVGIVMIIGLLLGLCYGLFVLGPLEVGHSRFYLESRFHESPFARLFYAFSCGSYGNVVKTMFLRNLKIFLWSLLFVIPGIIKQYEYAMVPYLLAENPSLSSERAFELSRQMMEGRKWDLFIVDCSFFGWQLLASAVVIGHLFLQPYIDATHTEVYLWLRYDALQNGYASEAELNGMYMQTAEYTGSTAF